MHISLDQFPPPISSPRQNTALNRKPQLHLVRSPRLPIRMSQTLLNFLDDLIRVELWNVIKNLMGQRLTWCDVIVLLIGSLMEIFFNWIELQLNLKVYHQTPLISYNFSAFWIIDLRSSQVQVSSRFTANRECKHAILFFVKLFRLFIGNLQTQKKQYFASV